MAINNALQNTFRTDFAESLIEEFSAKSDDQYFVFFGKINGWTIDTSPDLLVDSVESNFSSIRNSYGIKRIDRTNLIHVINRYDWISGASYVQYDDTVDLSGEQYYVMTDEYNLYKCIENGSGSKSTSKPTHTEPEIKASGDDGYKWKFLGKVTESARTFLTRDYIPIEYVTNADEDENSTQLSSQKSSINGSIDRINVTTQTSNLPYNAATPIGQSTSVQNVVYGSTDPLVLAGTKVAGTTLAIPDSIAYSGINTVDELIEMDILTVAGQGPDVGQIKRIIAYQGVGAGSTYTGPNDELSYHDDNFVTFDTPFTRSIGKSTNTPTEFRILPPVNVFGDGINAVMRTEVDDNLKISSVIPISRGRDYTKAWIEFPMTPSEGSNPAESTEIPSARVVISPKGGHGHNPVKELQTNKIMIVLSVNADEQEKLRTTNEYRQFGIIKNPILNSRRYGVTAGIAGTEYTRQTKLTISKPQGIDTPYSYIGENSTYVNDNYIIGQESFGTARIIDWYPNSGGTGNGNLIVENIQGNLVQGSLSEKYVRFVFGTSYGNTTDSGRTLGAGGDFIVGATATQYSARGWPIGDAPADAITGATAEGIVESWDSVHRELVIRVMKNSFTDSLTADYVKQPVYNGDNETDGSSASYWSFDGDDSRFENKGGELIKQYTIQSTAEGIYGGTSEYVTLTESTGEGQPSSTYSAYGRIMGMSTTEIDENLNPVYSTTTRLEVSSLNGVDDAPTIAGGRFSVDSGITQDMTRNAIPNASGKVIEYVHEVGTTQGNVYLTDVVGEFKVGEFDTQSELEGWHITGVEHPEIDLTSGEVLYIQNIRPVSRNIEQDEEYKIVIGF